LKTLIRWLIIHVILFVAIGVGAHFWLKSNPERVLVAVDASFDMTTHWPAVVELLDSLDDNPGPNTEYALISDKGVQHGWQKTLNLKNLQPFGPRNLKAFEKGGAHAELIKEATSHLLVTVGDGISGWSVRPFACRNSQTSRLLSARARMSCRCLAGQRASGADTSCYNR